jgi:hypothetical protein
LSCSDGVGSSRNSALSLPDFQFDVNYFQGDCLCDPHFDELASKFGTITAFHGSSLDNWHSIIHNGLKNLSGTKDMKFGALFGNGIYFSEDLVVSRMFSEVGRGWKDGRLGSQLEVVGMFELVNDPQVVLRQQNKDLDRLREQKRMKQSNTSRDRPTLLSKFFASSSSSSSGGNGGTASNTSEIPEKYFICQEASHCRLRSILVWKSSQVMDQPRRTVCGLRMSCSMLMVVAYCFLLIGLVLSQVQWQRVSRRWLPHIRDVLFL